MVTVPPASSAGPPSVNVPSPPERMNASEPGTFDTQVWHCTVAAAAENVCVSGYAATISPGRGSMPFGA